MKPSPTAQAEALRALETPGCAACHAATLSERRFASAFETELYTDPIVLRELGKSLGFCPQHCRLLLRRVEASTVLRGPYAYVISTVVKQLARGLTPRATRPCPACASRTGAAEGASWFIMRTLDTPEVADAYRTGGGFCLPHAVKALSDARPVPARIIVDTMLERLQGSNGGVQLVYCLAGDDPEVQLRRTLRVQLVSIARKLDPSLPGWPVTQRLRTALALEGCPVCLEAGLMEVRYLTWLGEEGRNRPRHLVSDGVHLCASHLHDLLLVDSAMGDRMGNLTRDRATWLLERFQEQVETSRHHGLPPLRTGRRSAWKLAHGALGHILECSLCAARAVSERRTLELLSAALSDRSLRLGYGRSHGLCLRHLPSMASEDTTSLPHRVFSARLSVLAWELDEAGRKSSWSNRHERNGDERTAWFRAPGLLDGWVFLGGPPRTQMSNLRDVPAAEPVDAASGRSHRVR
jgi:hypothetical protein